MGWEVGGKFKEGTYVYLWLIHVDVWQRTQYCKVIILQLKLNKFLINVFNFNWRIITLQYCGSFCHTSAWISHMCTCTPPSWTPLPPSFPPYPSGLSQSTSFGCPASCIKLALVICFTYGNIHVSMLFSHIIPPSPLPHSQKSVLYMSLLLPCI